MHILILGGTVFLGRHLVEAARARRHTITLFNRGKSNPDLFPDLETLTGDRDGGLTALEGRKWDAVIDTSGYVPRVVRASAELLADAARHYTFISSGSVYPSPVHAGTDESGEVAKLDDEDVEEVTGETYGALNALCEQAVREAFGDRALIVRAGLIVGPFDRSDRFTYWPVRVARGGEVLCPDRPTSPVQFIDVRDLADWIIRRAEQGDGGVYNTTGPGRLLTLGAVLETSKVVSGSDAVFTWVPPEFLEEQEIEPWMGMPLWVPVENIGFNQVSVKKAVAAGLTYRPLDVTIRDTLAWANARPGDIPLRAGISPEKEADALQAWRGREDAS